MRWESETGGGTLIPQKSGEPVHQWPALREWAAPGPTVSGDRRRHQGLRPGAGDDAPFGFLATRKHQGCLTPRMSPHHPGHAFLAQFIRYKELYLCACVSFSES